MNRLLDTESSLLLIERIACIGVIVSSIEWWGIAPQLSNKGLFSWDVLKLRRGGILLGPLGRLVDKVFEHPVVLFIPTARLLLASWLVLGVQSAVMRAVMIAALSAMTRLLYVRVPLGHDGSDQMASLILLVSAIGRSIPSPQAKSFAVIFIGLQGCVAYAAAGWAKRSAEGWRSGALLQKILTTSTYGAPVIGRYVGRRAFGLLSKGLLTWQCTFPLVLVLPERLAYLSLACGVVFHVANAALMGLNTFVWSFIATYPAILYTRGVAHELVQALWTRITV